MPVLSGRAGRSSARVSGGTPLCLRGWAISDGPPVRLPLSVYMCVCVCMESVCLYGECVFCGGIVVHGYDPYCSPRCLSTLCVVDRWAVDGVGCRG